MAEKVDLLKHSGLDMCGDDLADDLRDRGADISSVRDGGVVDAHVPIELIDCVEVPVSEARVENASRQLREAEQKGGTGQLAAVPLGAVALGQPLMIINNFEIVAGLGINGHNSVFSAARACTREEVYDARVIEAGTNDKATRFLRVIQGMQNSWELSGYSDRLTVFSAILIYRHDKMSGSQLGLNAQEADEVCRWVAAKEKAWGMPAMTIHNYLKVAENVDPELLLSVQDKKSDELEGPSLTMLRNLSDVLPGKHEIQGHVMNLAMALDMNGKDLGRLCGQVKECSTLQEAVGVTNGIDWARFPDAKHEDNSKRLRGSHDMRVKGAEVFMPAEKSLDGALRRLEQGITTGEDISPEQLEKVKEAGAMALQLSERFAAAAEAISQAIEGHADSDCATGNTASSFRVELLNYLKDPETNEPPDINTPSRARIANSLLGSDQDDLNEEGITVVRELIEEMASLTR